MIVDDHSIVRHGLRSILELEQGIEVVGEADSGRVALGMLDSVMPDIVLLDLSLGERGTAEGIDVCQMITAGYPQTGVIVLTTFLEERLVLQAIRSGARGYVLKDVDAIDLVKIVRAVNRGESALDTRSAALVMRNVLSGENVGQPALEFTKREMEIMHLLRQGYSNRQIGDHIAISASTVKFHIRKIMRKLDVNHRTEIVYTAGKLGLI